MFETSQFNIRPFKISDIDSFMEYRNNLEWMQYQSFKGLTKQEYIEKLLGKNDVEEGIQLAIIQKKDERLIGDLFLYKKENTLTIGYSIHPFYAKKGYMTAIIKAFINVLLSKYADCEIVAFSDKNNIASKKVLQKCGFNYETFVDIYDSELYVYKK